MFLIILLLIVAISVVAIPSFSMWRAFAKSQCVIEQYSYLRDLEYAVKIAREKNSVNPNFELKVKYCIDCIWFDVEKSSLMMKISEQNTPVNFPIETNFRGIGCDCDSCDAKKDDVYCANLRKDMTYKFTVTKDYVNFTGYVDSKNEFHPEGFSSQPCQPCVGYDESCGLIGSLRIPCCYELECKEMPINLWEVNWLGKLTGDSSDSWSGKKCFKSLGQRCTDYKECSIFQIQQIGTKAKYPCYTIGDDLTTRCCSPLLSKAQKGEGNENNPASSCTGYGGCEVYCGNITCGYVYNSPLERFTNICCKPLWEECLVTDNTWQCCAHQLLDKAIGEPPTQCLQDDGSICTSGSTSCHCCITPNYNCTYETKDYCCKPNACRTVTGLECGAEEECKCI
jgi:hypothetical protein